MAKNRQKCRKKQIFRKTVKNSKKPYKNVQKDKNVEKLSKKQSKMMKNS